MWCTRKDHFKSRSLAPTLDLLFDLMFFLPFAAHSNQESCSFQTNRIVIFYSFPSLMGQLKRRVERMPGEIRYHSPLGTHSSHCLVLLPAKLIRLPPIGTSILPSASVLFLQLLWRSTHTLQFMAPTLIVTKLIIKLFRITLHTIKILISCTALQIIHFLSLFA